MKKLVALLIVVSLLLTSFAGCQSKSVPSGGNGTENTSSDGNPTATAVPSEEDSNFNATGFPIVKDKITLNVLLCIRDMDTLTDINEMYCIKKLEELTNIHVNWEVVKESDFDTKLNLAFASGEKGYPDVIMSNNKDINYEDYGVTQKILLPLNDLIDQYMPNYKSRVEGEDTDVLAALRATDGNMYSIGNIIAQNINTIQHYFINQKWLDALKLKTPTTLKELTEVLRAFKNGDPNGNGQTDEIPYETRLDDVTYVFPMFGIPGNNLYIDNEKQIQFAPYQEGFRDALAWMHMLYTEGLVDVEVISQDATILNTKLLEGNVGFFTGWRLQQMGWDGGVTESCVLLNPVAADGYKVVLPRTMELAKRGAFITSTNKYVPETMRWLDAQIETEMMFTMFAGEENVGWKYNDKGLIETIDVPSDQNNALKSLNVNCLFFAPGKYYNSVYQMAPHRIEKMKYCKAYTDGGYLQRYSNDLLKLVPRTSEEIEKCTLIETNVNNTIKEYMASFITDGITDESWSTFKKIFEDMGIQEVISIYQKGLDSYDFQ